MSKKNIVHAPFSREEIKDFNACKLKLHTCGGPENIPSCQKTSKHNDGSLTATVNHLVCPCGKYKQYSFNESAISSHGNLPEIFNT